MRDFATPHPPLEAVLRRHVAMLNGADIHTLADGSYICIPRIDPADPRAPRGFDPGAPWSRTVSFISGDKIRTAFVSLDNRKFRDVVGFTDPGRRTATCNEDPRAEEFIPEWLPPYEDSFLTLGSGFQLADDYVLDHLILHGGEFEIWSARSPEGQQSERLLCTSDLYANWYARGLLEEHEFVTAEAQGNTFMVLNLGSETTGARILTARSPILNRDDLTRLCGSLGNVTAHIKPPVSLEPALFVPALWLLLPLTLNPGSDYHQYLLERIQSYTRSELEPQGKPTRQLLTAALEGSGLDPDEVIRLTRLDFPDDGNGNTPPRPLSDPYPGLTTLTGTLGALRAANYDAQSPASPLPPPPQPSPLPAAAPAAAPASPPPVPPREITLPPDDFTLVGQPELCELINEEIISVFRHPRAFARFGIDFPSNLLLCGRPGTGKTWAARKLEEYLGLPSFAITSEHVGSAYIHESAKLIGQIFARAAKAAPALVIIDEMEAFLSGRSSNPGEIREHHLEETAEFLRLLSDTAARHILVIGITNLIGVVDEAVKRSGRFDIVFELKPPTRASIAAVLHDGLDRYASAGELDLERAARDLEGCNLADVSLVIKHAKWHAALADHETITSDDLRQALRRLKAARRAAG